MAIQRPSNTEFDKWPAFRAAISTMINDGTYAALADVHKQMLTEQDGLRYMKHRMHGTAFGPTGYRRFLPWHRAYLIAFERQLRTVDSTLSIPYWDWVGDGGRLLGFAGLLGTAAARNLGTRPDEPLVPDRMGWFTDQQEFEKLTNLAGDYYPFARELESGPHNRGHDWIGGDMESPLSSANDVAFWLHHAQVDRIWALWQESNPGERAALFGEDAAMDPWEDEFNVENVDDISDLGADSYEYV